MLTEILEFCLCVFLLLFIYAELKQGKDSLDIPGPTALPFIGNLLQIHGKPLHSCFHNLARTYGNIFRIFIGRQRVVVLSGRAIKVALVRQPTAFAGRPSFSEMGVKFSHPPSLVMADYGRKWRLFRRMGHSALKVYGENTLQYIICTEIKDLCRRLENFNGKAVHINKEIGMSLTNVICTQILGSRYEVDDPEFLRVYSLNETITNTNVVRSVTDVFPLLCHFMKVKVNNLDDEIRSSECERFELLKLKYQQHQETFDENVTRDYTDALIRAKIAAEKEDNLNKKFLTDDNIISSLTSIFTAGSETTATTLCWAIIFLLHFPEIQNLLQEEIDDIIGGDDTPKLSNKKELPLLEAFTSEVLRMTYVTPLAIPHKTTQGTLFEGYHISKDTMVIVNLWSLHHDASIWKDPFKFDPKRFLDEEGKYAPPPGGDLLPFSAGPRGCMGEVLARTELFLFLSHLLQRFKFETISGCEPPSLDGLGSGTIIHSPDCRIIVKLR
ncbi:steroid 17-alpha-hydroxylase/17,20 lyase-like [Actinia tenebrosa]|uniref:Steroid 21-hydroxylase n=1 Tax=Actinia tenebrosa TaxID=6105 RepID=A0A6P8H7U9_ACTTE|nr:steroid 17-alpha-hydroxylase/17,20 lyase-like [Actinia tenebrosa]